MCENDMLGHSIHHKTGSQVTQLPSINFLVYLPRRTERPLYIVDPGDAKSPRESFLVPQWGGVVIYNARPDSASGTSPASSVKMGRVMPIFIEQLTALLGIPTKVTRGEEGDRGYCFPLPSQFRCQP